MPGLIQHIELEPRAETVSVSNNAAWAAGEIALQAGAEMEPWVQPLMERMVPVLLSAKAARSLTENSAVTIGRLAMVCPAVVAPHLEIFVGAWCVSFFSVPFIFFHSLMHVRTIRRCSALSDIKDSEEKDSAFRGICAAIQLNPNGISAVSLAFSPISALLISS